MNFVVELGHEKKSIVNVGACKTKLSDLIRLVSFPAIGNVKAEHSSTRLRCEGLER